MLLLGELVGEVALFVVDVDVEVKFGLKFDPNPDLKSGFGRKFELNLGLTEILGEEFLSELDLVTRALVGILSIFASALKLLIIHL